MQSQLGPFSRLTKIYGLRYIILIKEWCFCLGKGIPGRMGKNPISNNKMKQCFWSKNQDRDNYEKFQASFYTHAEINALKNTASNKQGGYRGCASHLPYAKKECLPPPLG